MIFMKCATDRQPATARVYRCTMNSTSLAHPLDLAGHAGTANTLRGFAIAANRPVQLALLLSALIHALALGWLPGLERLSAGAPLPLRILLPPPPPEVMPAAPAPAPPSAAARTAPNPAAATSQALAPPAPLAVPAPARADDAPVARIPAVIPTPVERSAAQTDLPPPAIASAGPPPLDGQVLAGYGRSVAGAVAVHQRYPKLAQMRQWQGTAMLQLEFAADGRLVETRVLSSSGHDVLDRQALDMVRAAQPLPPLPPALAGRALTVNVPVIFRLAG